MVVEKEEEGKEEEEEEEEARLECRKAFTGELSNLEVDICRPTLS